MKNEMCIIIGNSITSILFKYLITERNGNVIPEFLNLKYERLSHYCHFLTPEMQFLIKPIIRKKFEITTF